MILFNDSLNGTLLWLELWSFYKNLSQIWEILYPK